MHIDLLKKLCCPFDKGDLETEVHKQEGKFILEAVISCTICGRYFPVVSGIPIMTPDEYRQKPLESPLLARWGYRVSSEKSFKLSDSLTRSSDRLKE